MLHKYSKQTREILGAFLLQFSLVLYILGRFLMKQLFHSLLFDMRWLYPTHVQRELVE